MSQLFFSLGTNLGRRRHNLQQAIAGLRRYVTITAVSPVYETDPWGPVPQPPFLNICVAATTTLDPITLFTYCQQLEKELGREKTVRWGPRLIDIDLLFYDTLIYQNSALTIPHPRIGERAFVLYPLADIAPDFIHPQTGQKIADMATAVSPDTIRRLPQPLLEPGAKN
ncbi:MAG: 2-amino-4-hydroxy-6-hydroxymethyldihydropteridine diphosphokinase [Chloroflexi bacterium]|nr:MAG: 2-amino-4-hydroxy-6-hydroxymethyldihydropteridine diphosphokinase [Chloroflexota bacterium]